MRPGPAARRWRSPDPARSCMLLSSVFYQQAMQRGHTMRYLHTMLRVRNLDAALDFYCNKLALTEARRRVDEKNRYTLVFLAAPDDEGRVEDSKRTGRDAPLV